MGKMKYFYQINIRGMQYATGTVNAVNPDAATKKAVNKVASARFNVMIVYIKNESGDVWEKIIINEGRVNGRPKLVIKESTKVR